MLTREPSNPHDKSAVGVFKGNALVGHAPHNNIWSNIAISTKGLQ